MSERRRKPVAGLRTVTIRRPQGSAKKAQIFASMRKTWNESPNVGDSGKVIADDRGRG